jgi:alkanesulfonate monooxygenase SsuD/methylene tetrahydromethanopterin reductase-like flavin-dependent oxidoreductase (luciferase family)
MTGLEIGIGFGAFPTQLPDRHWLLEQGRRLDAAGYDYILWGDRPLWKSPFVEPITTLGMLAATTKRARLVVVLLLPLRNPMFTAREVAYGDYLAGGRVVVAPGLGGDYPEELRAAGITLDERVARYEEAIDALRHVWREDEAPFEGRFVNLPGASIRPTPPNGSVPLWLANRGRTDSALRRIVDRGDGWLASWVTVRRFRRSLDYMRTYAAERGQDLSDKRMASVVRVFVDDSVERAVQNTARFRADLYGLHTYDEGVSRAYHALGTPEQCAERIVEYVEAGANPIILQPDCPPDLFDDQLETITRELVPLLRRLPASVGAAPA